LKKLNRIISQQNFLLHIEISGLSKAIIQGEKMRRNGMKDNSKKIKLNIFYLIFLTALLFSAVAGCKQKPKQAVVP